MADIRVKDLDEAAYPGSDYYLLTDSATDGVKRVKTSNIVKPSDIGAATSDQGSLADSAVQPDDLATVATSGGYDDLSGRPTLGDLAAKDKVAISDLSATGTPSSSTVLWGDWKWDVPPGGGFRDFVSVKDYGAKGDAVSITGDISIASGSASLTVTGAAFVSGDIGKLIVVPGAGSSSDPLVTSIVAVTSETVVTLADSASADLSSVSKTVVYGTDDRAAIQSAIDARPVGGGDIIIPAGDYMLGNQLTIGNGSTSAASTRWGIRLIGLGAPVSSAALFVGYPANSIVTFKYAGPSNAGMVVIQGPLQGWGLRNICLDGLGVVNFCLYVSSGQYGDSENLTFSNYKIAGLNSTTVSSYSVVGGNADSLHNSYRNLTLKIPAIDGAAGIVLTGGNYSINTDYNTFYNTTLVIDGAPGVINRGIVFGSCDSNQFFGVHQFNGSADSIAVVFDYTSNAAWPASNQIYGIDPSGAGGITFANISTPNEYAAPNYVYGLVETNGATPPNLANLAVYSSHRIIHKPIGGGSSTFEVGSNGSVSSRSVIIEDDATPQITFKRSGVTQSYIQNDGTNFLLYSNEAATSGMYIVNGASSWSSISDARLPYKKTARPLNVLASIKDVHLYENEVDGRLELFVKAQELYRAFPHLVKVGSGGDDYVPTGVGDNKAWGVNYDRSGVVALQGVKELLARVEMLESRMKKITDDL